MSFVVIPSSVVIVVMFVPSEFDETAMFNAVYEKLQQVKDDNGLQAACALLHPGAYLHKCSEEKKYKADMEALANKAELFEVSNLIWIFISFLPEKQCWK